MRTAVGQRAYGVTLTAAAFALRMHQGPIFCKRGRENGQNPGKPCRVCSCKAAKERFLANAANRGVWDTLASLGMTGDARSEPGMTKRSGPGMTKRLEPGMTGKSKPGMTERLKQGLSYRGLIKNCHTEAEGRGYLREHWGPVLLTGRMP